MAKGELIRGPSGAMLVLILSEQDVRSVDGEFAVDLLASEEGFPSGLGDLSPIKIVVEVE